MNKIFLWEGDYKLIYPSLFIFDKILTLEDSCLDFVCSSVLDFAKDSGLPLETIIDLIKDKTINPIIMSTDRDEMKVCYDLLLARNKEEARTIGSLLTSFDICFSDDCVDYIMSLPKKTRENLSEIIDPYGNCTRSYYFVDYHPESLRGEKKILKSFREANEIVRNTSTIVDKYMRTSGYNSFDRELMSELVHSTTISKVFKCSVVEDNCHLDVYKKMLTQLENEIVKTPELSKILLETNKISHSKKY